MNAVKVNRPAKENTAKCGSNFFTPFFQPKLTINNPNDVYEQEADAVAEKVMRKQTPSIQTKTTGFFGAAPQIQKQDPPTTEPQVREGEAGDVVEAVTQLPVVSNFLTRVGDDFLLRLGNTWDASTINKIALIGGGLSLSAGLGLAVYAARNNPEALDIMVSPLSGMVIPAFNFDLFPNVLRSFALEVNFDRYDENSSIRNVMGGLHFDVGRLLPPAWGFGPVNEWSPMGAPWDANPVQRKCAHCEEEEKQTMRKEQDNNPVHAPQEMENYIGSLNGSGSKLAGNTKDFFESRMGYDFSDVKIHTDSVAAKSAQSINALAYTTGNNIVFNQNQYAPETDSGKKLLAHELTHVVQQSAGTIQPYRNKKAFNFGKADTKTLIEDSFNIKKDKESKPWIEQITITLDKKTTTDVNGYEMHKGQGSVKYYDNVAKLTDFSFTATAGSENLGMTTAGSYKVTRIEGIGYNSGKYSGEVDKTTREGPNNRYSKDLAANMSYAVFFHGGEALHAGPLDWSSHGCVHVDWGSIEVIQQINYHSVIGLTKVVVKYS